MFIEFTPDRDWTAYDHVIVGSGRVGLFLAERLARSGRVLLLEAGERTTAVDFGKGFYELESTGLFTEPLGTRLARFGGTSHQRGGQSATISRAAFGNRDGIAAGWPLSYEEYLHYLREARGWLGLRPTGTPPSGLTTGLLAGHEGIAEVRFDFPRAGGDVVMTWADRFDAAAGIDVLTLARVAELQLAPDGTRIGTIEIVDRRDGSRHVLPARNVIVCAGGIENARLLLWSGRNLPRGNPLSGGPNELTGRGFMEHPIIRPLQLYVDPRLPLWESELNERDGWPLRFAWTLTDEIFERHRLPRFCVFPPGSGEDPPDGDVADPLYLERGNGYRMTQPTFQFEQSPVDASFVALSDQRDPHGDAIARLHWTISDDDVEAYRRGTLLFAGLIAQGGLVRPRLAPSFRATDWRSAAFGRGHHHMGTTRMAHARTAGVVDTNGRVFGLGNLYIAGTSVFPNGDFANPTCNALALAVRLADHLDAGRPPEIRSLRLASGREATRALVSGWSAPEEDGVWSDGPRAVIELDGAAGRVMRLRGHAYAAAKVAMTINGRQVFDDLARLAIHTDFALDAAARQRIVLDFRDLASPSQLGENDDTRQLGIFLEWIDLR